MEENERIVCEFLRKIAPSREWRYLGEVEHYWIGELCDELNKQLKAENAKLRQQLADVTESMRRVEERCAKLRELVSGLEYCVGGYVCDSCPLYDPSGTNYRRCESLEQELGIEMPDE